MSIKNIEYISLSFESSHPDDNRNARHIDKNALQIKISNLYNGTYFRASDTSKCHIVDFNPGGTYDQFEVRIKVPTGYSEIDLADTGIAIRLDATKDASWKLHSYKYGFVAGGQNKWLYESNKVDVYIPTTTEYWLKKNKEKNIGNRKTKQIFIKLTPQKDNLLKDLRNSLEIRVSNLYGGRYFAATDAEKCSYSGGKFFIKLNNALSLREFDKSNISIRLKTNSILSKCAISSCSWGYADEFGNTKKYNTKGEEAKTDNTDISATLDYINPYVVKYAYTGIQLLEKKIDDKKSEVLGNLPSTFVDEDAFQKQSENIKDKQLSHLYFSFCTPDSGEGGTDSDLVVEVLGKRFVFDTHNVGDDDSRKNTKIPKGFSCEWYNGNKGIYELKDDAYNDLLKRGHTDTLEITLPEDSSFTYSDLLKSSIRFGLGDRAGEDSDWTVGHFKLHYKLRGDENRIMPYIDTNCIGGNTLNPDETRKKSIEINKISHISLFLSSDRKYAKHVNKDDLEIKVSNLYDGKYFRASDLGKCEIQDPKKTSYDEFIVKIKVPEYYSYAHFDATSITVRLNVKQKPNVKQKKRWKIYRYNYGFYSEVRPFPLYLFSEKIRKSIWSGAKGYPLKNRNAMAITAVDKINETIPYKELEDGIIDSTPLVINRDNSTALYDEIYKKATENPTTKLHFRHRIEPFVRNTKGNDIQDALSMRIHDPLWMLARQWQFGEFKGNDAGSAVLAKLKAKKTPVEKLYAVDGVEHTTDITNMPIEPLVESLPANIDLQDRVESAYYFVSMVRSRVGNKTMSKLMKSFQEIFQLELPTFEKDTAEGLLNAMKAECKRDVPEYLAAFANKSFDGYKLYTALNNKTADSLEKIEELGLSKEIVKEYTEWFAAKYHCNPNPYWKQEELNYRFGVKTQTGATELVANDYDSGKVSWFSFEKPAQKTEDIDERMLMDEGVMLEQLDHDIKMLEERLKKDPNNIDLQTAVAQVKRECNQYNRTKKEDTVNEKMFTFIPTSARYAGMPKKRLWEIEEDGGVVMGVTKGIGVKHYANALILQYATMYANDWMMLPMEVDINTLTEIESVVVSNVFGDKTIIRAQKNEKNEHFLSNWEMFTLSGKNPYLNNDFSTDKRMYYPPALYNGMESEPIEEIQFIRDELTNMVWGVENIIDQGCGVSLDGKHFAAMLEDKIEQNNMPTKENTGTETENETSDYAYTFQNNVPANWIPFMPVRFEKDKANYNREIRLQRAKMPVYLKSNEQGEYVGNHPSTSYLKEGVGENNYKPLFINEEEISAVGAKLTKTFQRTRWLNGKTFNWIGYKKQWSGMQGNSGLEFDKLTEKEKTKTANKKA